MCQLRLLLVFSSSNLSFLTSTSSTEFSSVCSASCFLKEDTWLFSRALYPRKVVLSFFTLAFSWSDFMFFSFSLTVYFKLLISSSLVLISYSQTAIFLLHSSILLDSFFQLALSFSTLLCLLTYFTATYLTGDGAGRTLGSSELFSLLDSFRTAFIYSLISLFYDLSLLKSFSIFMRSSARSLRPLLDTLMISSKLLCNCIRSRICILNSLLIYLLVVFSSSPYRSVYSSSMTDIYCLGLQSSLSKRSLPSSAARVLRALMGAMVALRQSSNSEVLINELIT